MDRSRPRFIAAPRNQGDSDLSEMLFRPEDVREWSADEQEFVATAYRRAIDALKRTITPLGFAACSLADNEIYGTDVNYRSVWARDGAMTLIWTLDLQDQAIRDCQRNTLRTLVSPSTLVRFDSDERPDRYRSSGVLRRRRRRRNRQRHVGRHCHVSLSARKRATGRWSKNSVRESTGR